MRIILLAAISSLVLMLSACGGSSSSVTPAVASSQGTLTLLVGDGPREDFDQVMLTITGSRLIGNTEHSITLDEPVTVDLLKLRNLNELLVQAQVPAGDYSKIRLYISNLELNNVDATGMATDQEEPPLPANGHIDLNPQGRFEVVADADTVIEIDFDLDRSLQINSTGNGSYRFRPVVFVDVLEPEASGRLVRLFGELTDLNADGNFQLCDSTDECVRSRLASDAVLMDSVGVATTVGGLINNEQVSAFGRFQYDNTDGSRWFNVLALVQVTEEILESLDGTVVATPVDSVMDIDVDGQAVTVEFLEGAIVLGDDGTASDQASIVADQGIEVWGLTPSGSQTLQVIVAKLDDIEAAEADIEREGTYVSDTDGVYQFVDEQQVGFCVVFGEAPSIFEIMTSAAETNSTEIDLETFIERLTGDYYTNLNGVELEFEGSTLDDDGCLVVKEVEVEVESS